MVHDRDGSGLRVELVAARLGFTDRSQPLIAAAVPQWPIGTLGFMDAAISPLDGRYREQLSDFAAEFSEAALMRQRFGVEVEWLLTLAARPDIPELGPIADTTQAVIRSWVTHFGPEDVTAIKVIEATTRHDVKAVEYHLKAKLADIGFGPGAEFVHFACTSEDVNNLAYTLMVRDGLAHAWTPRAQQLVAEVATLADTHAALPMPSHTHGQVATPTTFGKEMAVFVHRWRRQLRALEAAELLGKCNGAVGTYAAHHAAYPDVPWIEVSRQFVTSFGLAWNPLTTQIEPHDSLAEVLHILVRWNAILIDFCRDIWEYISRGYLLQRAISGEVGSSTMPHKVNPIDFENAEANAGVSSSLLEHLATKLMVSRLQRDLSDSSAIRNIGVGVAHSGLALIATLRGLARIDPSPRVMAAALDTQWEVLAEPIQTVMRRYGHASPYERLKELTRGASVGPVEVHSFIADLGLPADAEARLLALTPAGYVGLAPELVGWATDAGAEPS